MLQFLFDTDHLTLLELGQPALLQRMAQQPVNSIGVSAVTVEEALRGRLGFLSRPLQASARIHGYGLLLRTVALMNQLPLVPYEVAAETEYAQLRAQHIRIGTLDLRIAAVALTNQLILLTRNHKDFSRVPGLRIDDWSI
jgi:tRNA(fMet)-specific endonuclease VapC